MSEISSQRRGKLQCGHAVMAPGPVRHKEQQKVPTLVVFGLCPVTTICAALSAHAALVNVVCMCIFPLYYAQLPKLYAYGDVVVKIAAKSPCSLSSVPLVSSCSGSTLILDAVPDQLILAHVCYV